MDKVQQYINSSINGNIKRISCELLIGKKMCLKDDVELHQAIHQEDISQFQEDRNILRDKAKKIILKIQEENWKNFNQKRKSAMKYKVEDIVVIQRTQLSSGLTYSKFLGLYKITSVLRNNRYCVEKLGDYKAQNELVHPLIISNLGGNIKYWFQISIFQEIKTMKKEVGIKDNANSRMAECKDEDSDQSSIDCNARGIDLDPCTSLL